MRQWLFHKSGRLLLSALVMGLAFWILQRELRDFQFADMLQELRALPPQRVLAAVLLTAVSYFTMTGYDVLAVRYAGHGLAYRRVALASFTGYAVSNTLGFPWLTGAPLRYRFYSSWGVPTLDIAKIVAFYSLTFWLGFLAVGGVAFLVDPISPPGWTLLSAHRLRWFGCALLILLVLYVGAAVYLRRGVTLHGIRLDAPGPRMAALQIALSSIDWLLAASVAYVLFPSGAISLPAFVGLFLFAQVAGLVSHVPGGLGVFESVVLACMPNDLSTAQVVGSLLLFRAIYYLIPFAIAGAVLLVHQVTRRA